MVTQHLNRKFDLLIL